MREVTAVVLLASERGGAQGNLLLFTSKFNLMHILLCSFVVSFFFTWVQYINRVFTRIYRF